jgi:hypothetical protein
MAYKDLGELVGLTIKAIVAKAGSESPQHQILLVFEDDSIYELYVADGKLKGSWMHGNHGMAKALSYCPENRVVEQHPVPKTNTDSEKAGEVK